MTDRDTKIMDAATALFLRDGVGVSTASIAKAAGVSNGTLFNAFANKQALIDAIYKRAKTAMFACLIHKEDAPFTRQALRENWDRYLDWARAQPADRQIMHLLLDAGLASPETRAEIDAMSLPHAIWLERALAAGQIRGPNAAFIAKLILFQIDLVITETLEGEDADLAFDMLCNSIGLTQ